MKRYGFVAGLLISLLAAALTVSAAGSKTIHYTFKGQTASASFYKADTCVETYVNVYAGDTAGKQGSYPAPNQKSSIASITISQYDLCPSYPYPYPYYPPLMAASGSIDLARQQFKLSPTLDATALNMTIPVYDSVSNTSFPVDVKIAWSGLGGIYRYKGQYQYEYPGFKIKRHYDDSRRNAVASGSIQYRGATYMLESTYFADMSTSKSGELTITRQ